MLILHNGNILSDQIQPQFSEAIAIRENKILAAGKNEDVLSLANRNDYVKDLHGKTVLPGLTDSHIHLQHTAENLSMVDCETDSVSALYKRIAQKVKNTEPGKWILGHGWNQNHWKNGFSELPTLDNLSNVHPIYLTAKSLHAAWANKKAIDLAGINAKSIDPPGGVIGRNQDNFPNGLVFEKAMDLIYQVIPQRTKAELIPILEKTQTELWKYGITSVHDFDGIECFRALQELDRNNYLKMRVIKNIPSAMFEEMLSLDFQTGFGSEFLKLGSIKLFADGALGPQTAAMIDPYENDAENNGILLLRKEEIIDYGNKATKNGLSLAIHAIGDKANHEVINAFAEIRTLENKLGLPPQNHRIEHVQILQDQDLARLAELSIIASMQPIHLISDMDTADQLWGKRSKNAYAFKSLLNNGTTLIFGSDSPVESFNPFIGIHAALNRKKLNHTPEKGWYPEQGIELVNIINAYTINSATVSNWDWQIGNLAVGKKADLIVLPNNIFSIPKNEIADLLPDATMVDGEWVYQREEI